MDSLPQFIRCAPLVDCTIENCGQPRGQTLPRIDQPNGLLLELQGELLPRPLCHIRYPYVSEQLSKRNIFRGKINVKSTLRFEDAGEDGVYVSQLTVVVEGTGEFLRAETRGDL